jgi:hypothetical protein
MTLIGAFKCPSGVVLLADRQETIADYAKWDVGKIAHFELSGEHRVFMAGAGDSDTIDMINEQVIEAWAKDASRSNADIKALILRTLFKITKKSILPYANRDRPCVNLIWAIQQISNPGINSIELFRTSGLAVNSIRRPYFTGSPLLLTHFLSDMYLDNVIIDIDEAEALAAYVLWEAKEYDPSVGKHSDIFTLRINGTIGRLDRSDERYWEEHFLNFKKSLKILPLITCSTGMAQALYPDYLDRLKTTLDTLKSEQMKMRQRTKKDRSRLEIKLSTNIHKAALSFLRKRERKQHKRKR